MIPKGIFFVVNPISGGVNKEDIIKKLNALSIPGRKEVFIWDKIHELKPKLQTLSPHEFGWIVVVGGDGTLNAVIQDIDLSQFQLSIIPKGSGNGFARSMGITTNNINAAFFTANKEVRQIDWVLAGSHKFINVAGLGFDAEIARLFAHSKRRGFLSYVLITLKAFKAYPEHQFELKWGNRVKTESCWLIALANGSQWGNNFHIASKASFSDGLLDVVLLKKPKWYQIPSLVLSLRAAKPHKLISAFQTEQLDIYSATCDSLHLDGEPQAFDKNLSLRIAGKAQFVVP
jgi:YegS/Rv2252/BmrU family lipid kinase